MDYKLQQPTTQPPFFINNSNLDDMSQCYRDDDMMDFQTSWNDHVEPIFRNRHPQPPSRSQSQWQNQQTMERFIGESNRNFFAEASFPNQSQGYINGINQPSIPISTLPQTSTRRMVSPAPSQDFASTCGSARSPGTENDVYQEPNLFQVNYPTSEFVLMRGTPFEAPEYSGDYAQMPTRLYGMSELDCVNLNQVQLNPDPQELQGYDADEGYIDMGHDIGQKDYAEVENPQLKPSVDSFRYPPSDEGIGASIKSAASPEENHGVHNAENDSDMDAEGDIENDEELENDEPSDYEYSPKARHRPRKAINTPVNQAHRRSRVTKSFSKSKTGTALYCKQCNKASFKDIPTLTRHITNAHNRAYTCVYDFAGCDATFGNKNEWKRHVTTQHLKVDIYICNLPGNSNCSKARTLPTRPGGPVHHGAEFNRKDLFSSHLDRMHIPFALKRLGKKGLKDPAWVQKVKDLQASCCVHNRDPPKHVRCPLVSCGEEFEGTGAWDMRMEHVGKHLEKASKGGKVVKQGDDELLVSWSLEEGIIELKAGGGYRLKGLSTRIGGVSTAADEDDDAEGEEEY